MLCVCFVGSGFKRYQCYIPMCDVALFYFLFLFLEHSVVTDVMMLRLFIFLLFILSSGNGIQNFIPKM